MPKRSRAFWARKFNANRRRDRRAVRALRASGQRVVVFWECECDDRTSIALQKLAGIRSDGGCVWIWRPRLAASPRESWLIRQASGVDAWLSAASTSAAIVICS